MNSRLFTAIALFVLSGCDDRAPATLAPPPAPSLSLAPAMITDLGTIGEDEYSTANAINDRGQIVGSSRREVSGGSPIPRAALWTVSRAGVTVQDLGVLPDGDAAVAYDINRHGQAVGYSTTPTDQGQVRHATLWTVAREGVTMQDLGTLPEGVTSTAFGINGHGQIVGMSSYSSDLSTAHATLWTVGRAGVTVQDLGTLAGFEHSIAYAINKHGQIAGWSSNGSGPFGETGHVVLWTLGPAGVTMQDLGLGTTPEAVLAQAYGISAGGQAVGIDYGVPGAGEQQATLWTVDRAGVAVQNLGTLPEGELSEAWDMNAHGQIVGLGDAPDIIFHGVLWTVGRTGVTIQDLGALPGGLFSRANAINDHGQIVGESQYLGAAHAVLWSVGHD